MPLRANTTAAIFTAYLYHPTLIIKQDILQDSMFFTSSVYKWLLAAEKLRANAGFSLAIILDKQNGKGIPGQREQRLSAAPVEYVYRRHII